MVLGAVVVGVAVVVGAGDVVVSTMDFAGVWAATTFGWSAAGLALAAEHAANAPTETNAASPTTIFLIRTRYPLRRRPSTLGDGLVS